MKYSLLILFAFLIPNSSFNALSIANGKSFQRVEVSVTTLTNSKSFLQISHENEFSSQNEEMQENSLNDTKNWKAIISAFFVVLAIILVALMPKGLLIYFAWHKPRSNQQTDDATEAPTPPHVEPKPDIFFEEMRNLVMKNDPIFLKRFTEVYPDFTQRILHKHPQLSKSELSLCAMIFLNFSSKEIAEYTFIQHRSVQTNRSRLRKKNAALFQYGSV